jgi:hypothetical protein
MIAILDALGAARYGDREIARFLESRQRVLDILHEKAHAKEVRGEIETSAVSTFTFNDTVLIVFRTPSAPSLAHVEHFGLLLRKFQVDSLAQGILFRGSIGIGTFYVDDQSNTVMGSAVTDAAAWYNAAEWVGINATPHARWKEKRGRESFLDMEESLPVEGIVCRVVHVLLRVRLPTMS